MSSHVLTLDSRDLALDLYTLLGELDPSRWQDDLEVVFRQRLAEIEERLSYLLHLSWPEELGATVREQLGELARLLREGMPAMELPTYDVRQEWKAFRQNLQASYNSLALSLQRFDIHVPSLRPTNYARNILHVGSALFALTLVELVLTPVGLIAVAGGFAVYAWSMEIARRHSPQFNERLMRLYGPVAHPHEWRRVNSATWYTTALLCLSLTGSTLLCSVSLVILGFADPAAGLIGRRWGRIRLIHGRSLEGSLTFLAVGGLAAVVVMMLWHPEVKWPAMVAIALGASLPAAIAELVTRRIDDNFVIPMSAAAGAWLVATNLGVPL